MKKRLLCIIMLTLVVGATCAPLSAPVDTPMPEDIAYQVVKLINVERRDMGLKPFVINDQLVWMAQVRSDDMMDSDYLSHFPPQDHPTLESLTEQLEYNVMRRPVENIALIHIHDGRLDDIAQRAVDNWRGSPGHWRWITSEYYWITGVGVTVENGKVIITQLFWGASSPAGAQAYNREAP